MAEVDSNGMASDAPRRCMSAQGMIDLLYERFDIESASDADLSFLAMSGEHVATSTEQLGDVLTGLGCLVAADVHDGNVGSFQGADLSELLFTIARDVGILGRLSSISGYASQVLGERRRGMHHAQ